ncbi:NAD(P)-dependent oxidoreductase [Chryseosolibacter indicus]|uniref:Phosphoglycerate dehydrogenase n=1 Tax=Chryseosolibacter indicus TaxID=2782351 RepID=A0ABS5VQP3_9BACT|nr:NAD(P)-dependent oxidoreductase [Chryseosolibacter indicus]MBT1702331.1 phosphoglycerate dehydrogenase [Chryseosolibacter indicus]
MTQRKCLIVDSMHHSLMPMLDSIGWTYDYKPDITRDEIRQLAAGYDGLIIRSKTNVDKDLLGENPTVRYIGRAGAGLDNLDLEYLKSKNIAVLHAAEGNRDAVGEFTVGLLLSLLRNIPKANTEVRNVIWDREGNRGEEIMGKTISIIGYGNMGRAFAQRISGFGCKILAYDKYKNGFSTPTCYEATMDVIFDETDILTLHIPLTSETRKLVDLKYLKRFKKNIVLLNTARGEIVPLADLAEAMNIGKVRGAALDVLENEKIQKLSAEQQNAFDDLKKRSNVILTPHIAGWTYESHEKINVALVDQINALQL